MSYYYFPSEGFIDPRTSGEAQRQIAELQNRGITSGPTYRELQDIKHGVIGDPHTRPNNPWAKSYDQSDEATKWMAKHTKY